MSDIHGRGWSILVGDVVDRLRELPNDHFHCVVTSPPYWGLRDYGTAHWVGGDPKCKHRSPTMRKKRNENRRRLSKDGATNSKQLLLSHSLAVCGKCGAVKNDRQLGLEKTPEEYIENLLKVFDEVKRVLRPDGTLWINIGDCYSSQGGPGISGKHSVRKGRTYQQRNVRTGVVPGLKKKDLVGIPWRLAFALQQSGWWLRQENIWHKRNPMPESTKDRPIRAHEQVFLLTKSATYFYDHIRVRVPGTGREAGNKSDGKYSGKTKRGEHRTKEGRTSYQALDSANLRSVWSLSSEPYKGAHFATYPTQLVRRCVLAGTSESGCCPSCGRPIERMVQRERVATRPGTNSKVLKRPSGWNGSSGSHQTNIGRYGGNAGAHEESPYQSQRGEVIGNRDPFRHVTKFVTVGWKQLCDCEPKPAAPCRVLDPFCGSGTTIVVARRLHSEAVGIDLNDEYARLAADRIVGDAPLFNAIVGGK